MSDHEKLVKQKLVTANMEDWRQKARAQYMDRIGSAQALALQALVDDPRERLHILTNLLAGFAATHGLSREDLMRKVGEYYDEVSRDMKGEQNKVLKVQ